MERTGLRCMRNTSRRGRELAKVSRQRSAVRSQMSAGRMLRRITGQGLYCWIEELRNNKQRIRHPAIPPGRTGQNKYTGRTSFYSFLFKIMSAAITPGTQPIRVRRNTINTDPQPRSITARGGKITANRTCKQDISANFLQRYNKNYIYASFLR